MENNPYSKTLHNMFPYSLLTPSKYNYVLPLPGSNYHLVSSGRPGKLVSAQPRLWDQSGSVDNRSKDFNIWACLDE